jgi:uncharacterized membrane protein
MRKVRAVIVTLLMLFAVVSNLMTIIYHVDLDAQTPMMLSFFIHVALLRSAECARSC